MGARGLLGVFQGSCLVQSRALQGESRGCSGNRERPRRALGADHIPKPRIKNNPTWLPINRRFGRVQMSAKLANEGNSIGSGRAKKKEKKGKDEALLLLT